MTYSIFADNKVEGLWFRSLSPRLTSSEIRLIGPRGQNVPCIDSLIAYDRPDIILLYRSKPILVLEKTREVPTGHNVGQRVARLVRAVEEGVPTIKFFPFDAMKHGDYAGTCNLNIRLLEAFRKMSEIHQVPILAVNWTCDDFSELVDDGTENEVVARLVDGYLASGHRHDCDVFRSQAADMVNEYKQRLRRRPSYAKAPPSVRTVDTVNFLAGLPLSAANRQLLARRSKSIVYLMEMTPDKCRREDPYTGTQFIYDYLWCRSGPRPENKAVNLFLHFPKITRARWFACNPNDPHRKSCNWYLTASALVLSDAVEVLRG